MSNSKEAADAIAKQEIVNAGGEPTEVVIPDAEAVFKEEEDETSTRVPTSSSPTA